MRTSWLNRQTAEGVIGMEKAFYLARWPKIRKGLLTILDEFHDEDLAFTPVEGGWTTGRIMLHISSAANYWLHSGILSPDNVYRSGESTLENYPTLDAIRAYLADEQQRTLSLLEGFDINVWNQPFRYPDGYYYTPGRVFWHVLEHEIHHRGELSLIMGLLGRDGLDV